MLEPISDYEQEERKKCHGLTMGVAWTAIIVLVLGLIIMDFIVHAPNAPPPPANSTTVFVVVPDGRTTFLLTVLHLCTAFFAIVFAVICCSTYDGCYRCGRRCSRGTHLILTCRVCPGSDGGNTTEHDRNPLVGKDTAA